MTENERITAKEGGQGGLTEGQQAQLARNDKAITAVRLQASRSAGFVLFFFFYVLVPSLCPLAWDRLHDGGLAPVASLRPGVVL